MYIFYIKSQQHTKYLKLHATTLPQREKIVTRIITIITLAITVRIAGCLYADNYDMYNTRVMIRNAHEHIHTIINMYICTNSSWGADCK